MTKNLALFDFDGTLTRKDTFIEFIKHYHGATALYKGMAKHLAVLLKYKVGMVPNWHAKEKILTHFFGGEPLATFDQKARDFSLNKIPTLLRKQALARLYMHKERGDEVVVVSASAENWLAPWCALMEVKMLGTRLEVLEGRVTGLIEGFNCYGQEKVNRINQLITTADYNHIYVYGDTRGDKEMLELATHKYYRTFPK